MDKIPTPYKLMTQCSPSEYHWPFALVFADGRLHCYTALRSTLAGPSTQAWLASNPGSYLIDTRTMEKVTA